MSYGLVSIIVPTYGRPDKLKRAISSALKQEYQEIEVVVVDDNTPGTRSRIETEKIMSGLSDERLIYLKMESNSGGAKARNVGVNASSGKYVCFLDDDDLLNKSKVGAQAKHLVDFNLDLSLCYLRVCVDPEFRGGRTIVPVVGTLKDFVINGVMMNGMLMLKKEIFEKVEGFPDIPRFQDHVMMYKIFALKPRIGVLKDELYYAHASYNERISNGYRSKEGYSIRHCYEDKYLYLLNDKEKKELVKRQAQSIFRCDISTAEGVQKVIVITSFLIKPRYDLPTHTRINVIVRYFSSKSRALRAIRHRIFEF